MERVRGGGGGGWPLRSVLVFLLSLTGWPGDAAAALLPRGAPGLGEGLLVHVLLRMHLFVQEVAGQLAAVLNLQLGNREDTYGTRTGEHTLTHTTYFSIYVCMHVCMYLSIYLSTYLSMYLSIRLKKIWVY